MTRSDALAPCLPARRTASVLRRFRPVAWSPLALALAAVACGSSSAPATDAGAASDAAKDAPADGRKSRDAAADGAVTDAAAKDAGADSTTGKEGGGATGDAGVATGDTGVSGGGKDASGDSPVVATGDAGGAQGSKDSGKACTPRNSTPYAGDAAVTTAAGNTCATATPIPINLASAHIDLFATTVGATHDVTAPCAGSDGGAGAPDVFYQLQFTRPAFVYADTFGASWATVLYLLKSDCTAMSSPTMAGGSVCSDGACGVSQAQIVAYLTPGVYFLGLTGRGSAQGAATIHFEYALAGSGTPSPLPQGNTVQIGTTSGPSDITNISSACLAGGPENAYWWTSCPCDTGGALAASTCGGASFETTLAVEIPQSFAYSCSIDACDSQTTINATVPAGPGLRVLVVDGETPGAGGPYTLTVDRP